MTRETEQTPRQRYNKTYCAELEARLAQAKQLAAITNRQLAQAEADRRRLLMFVETASASPDRVIAKLAKELKKSLAGEQQ